jgi:hypothetical protein
LLSIIQCTAETKIGAFYSPSTPRPNTVAYTLWCHTSPTPLFPLFRSCSRFDKWNHIGIYSRIQGHVDEEEDRRRVGGVGGSEEEEEEGGGGAGNGGGGDGEGDSDENYIYDDEGGSGEEDDGGSEEAGASGAEAGAAKRMALSFGPSADAETAAGGAGGAGEGGEGGGGRGEDEGEEGGGGERIRSPSSIGDWTEAGVGRKSLRLFREGEEDGAVEGEDGLSLVKTTDAGSVRRK